MNKKTITTLKKDDGDDEKRAKEGAATNGLARKATMEKKKEMRKKGMNTYMQIDGEYYKVINPKKIVITLNPEFPRLKVLKFNPNI
jgi:hypothetical protein